MCMECWVSWRGGMGLQGCDSDSLSKPAGRGPDERGIERRRPGVEWGKENPAPLIPPDSTPHSASAKNPNVIKMEVVFGLFTAPRLSACVWSVLRLSDHFTAKILTWVEKQLPETKSKPCVNSLGERRIPFSQNADGFLSVDEWKGNITG